MQIQKATKKDVRRISYLIRKNTEKVAENNYSWEQIATWKKANSPKAIEKSMEKRIIFCAFQNNKLIGTIGLQGNEVVGLYVGYTKRKSGVGKTLLKYLEQYSRNRNLDELVLTSTPSAKRFYQSNGYKPIKTVIVVIGNVAFKETEMRKKL